MKWAYGVTTVPERCEDLLPRTLLSLRAGGFEKPHLFIDGDKDPAPWQNRFGCEVTLRWPRIRAYGNWILALAELVLRDPLADRYLLAQDDMVTYKNLRLYLERCPYPRDGYLNLYTFPENQGKIPVDTRPDRQQSQMVGWFLSNQRGRGAVALVFSQDIVYKLLGSPHTWTRLRNPDRGWKAVDGGVVTALAHQGIKEYVHNPSLVQHTGEVSTVGNAQHAPAISFRGEHFDAMDLLKS